MAQSSGQSTDLSTVLAMDANDPRLRWLMLWDVSPTGECCCPLGSAHTKRYGASLGATLDCGSGAGKHPWWLWGPDGKPVGYRHGVAEADESQAAAERRWGPIGGGRRWGVSLRDLILIDVDSERSLLALYRIWRCMPPGLLGIARTPRGWHLYLDAPGWNQRALNAAMKDWLGDWHGTDPAKVSRRGFLLDVRTGANRYAVWPMGDRRWASPEELRAALLTVGGAATIPTAGWYHSDAERAPWNLPMTDELRTKIATLGQSAPVVVPRRMDGSSDVHQAMHDLRRWCAILRSKKQGDGRNNMLNQIAYHSGTAAVAAGIPEATVRSELTAAALASGLEERETDATITSGLTSGLGKIKR